MIPVVILCGGRGMRLNERTEALPKPMVEVGGMPILWHIMKGYAVRGFKRFILCLGYKGEKIHEFFAPGVEDWDVTCVDTGLEMETGGRFRRIENLIDTPVFFATYGDNVSDVSAADILATHKQKGCVATMTCVRASTTFGILDLAPDGLVSAFREKPRLDMYMNGGFFCFNRNVFSYILDNEVFEKEPLQRLVAGRQLAAHVHDGYWACMDTFKDNQALNEAWARGVTPWRVW